MRVIDRFFLFLFSMSFSVLAVYGLLMGLQIFIRPELVRWAIDQFYQDTELRWIVTGISLLVLVVALRFVTISLFSPKKGNSGIERETEMGSICISLQTIENIVVRTVHTVKGILDLTARIQHQTHSTSIKIQLKITVDGEIPIQPLSEQIQQLVKEQVEKITGVQVDEVSVYVAQTIQPTKSRVRVTPGGVSR